MRRLVILAEGRLGVHSAKTAVGVLRFGVDPTVAIIDSTRAGEDAASALGLADVGVDVPVVATIEEALAFDPTALLIGIAPIGGRLPDEWRPTLLRAIAAGLEIISGLHVFLNDDPQLSAAAREHGVRLWDVRRPPDEVAMRIGAGQRHRPGSRVVYLGGSDCNSGKMTVALTLDRAARKWGWNSAFAATGQTGIMIAGAGVPADRFVADFLPGGVEQLVLDLTERHDWVFVEGQGSLGHPAYSAVTLGLIHGAQPDLMILCHEAGRDAISGYPDYPLPSLAALVQMYETAAGWIKPARVAGIALNTFQLPEDEARAAIAAAAVETGLPTTDPIRFGAEVLLDALVEAAADQ
ncbi:MAG TPA: DUF1611 domain-containing protein [Ktedonobacterales bacterium]|nr:DUF1611 domain-containing protein [Ktedonobacterales bacterium]